MNASFRLKSAAITLLSASLPVAILSAVCYSAGVRIDPELRYLDPSRAPTVDEAIMLCSVEYAFRSNESNDVVFIGDSACARGIDPRRLREFSSYNLASFGGMGPRGFLVVLGAYLAHHPKPKLVVFCVSPFAFELDAHAKGGDSSERLVENYGHEVPGLVSPWQSFSYFAQRGAQSFAAFKDRRNDPLEYRETETYWTIKPKVFEQRGFLPVPRDGGGADPDPRPTSKLVREEWADGADRIATLCESLRVPVLVRLMPTKNYLADARDWSELERWATPFETARPNVRVVRPLVTLYDPGLMWDHIHLNARGVDKFAPVIAADIHRVLHERDQSGR
jgi:hypothetical protein